MMQPSQKRSSGERAQARTQLVAATVVACGFVLLIAATFHQATLGAGIIVGALVSLAIMTTTHRQRGRRARR